MKGTHILEFTCRNDCTWSIQCCPYSAEQVIDFNESQDKSDFTIEELFFGGGNTFCIVCESEDFKMLCFPDSPEQILAFNSASLQDAEISPLVGVY